MALAAYLSVSSAERTSITIMRVAMVSEKVRTVMHQFGSFRARRSLVPTITR